LTTSVVNQEKKMLPCPHCNRCYANNYTLRRHIESIHESQESESEDNVSENNGSDNAGSEDDSDTEDVYYTYDDVRAILRYFRTKNNP